MVDQDLLNELQKIIREDYGREVDMKTITQIANDLVGYFDLAAKIWHRIETDAPIENEDNDNSKP